MSNGEEEEKDATRAQERGQDIDHQRDMGNIASQLGEEVGQQHEDRCPRRMTNLQFVATGDEFRTVPQTGCGLYGQTIDQSGNGEDEPCREDVDF